jgi:hypothetical protein
VDGETALEIAGRPDTTAVRVDDRAADGETHAQSLRLGADEVLEDPLELPVLDADPGVRDLDRQAARLGLAAAQRDGARSTVLPSPARNDSRRLRSMRARPGYASVSSS